MKTNLSPSLKKEIAEIFRAVGKYPEARDFGSKMISTLKSEAEGRGVIPETRLNRLRKAWKAMLGAFEEDDQEAAPETEQ